MFFIFSATPPPLPRAPSPPLSDVYDRGPGVGPPGCETHPHPPLYLCNPRTCHAPRGGPPIQPDIQRWARTIGNVNNYRNRNETFQLSSSILNDKLWQSSQLASSGPILQRRLRRISEKKIFRFSRQIHKSSVKILSSSISQ
jgi:hypothetical protein